MSRSRRERDRGRRSDTGRRERAADKAAPERRRRSRAAPPAPEFPTGWRSSRRRSRVRKEVERAITVHKVRRRVSDATYVAKRTVRDAVYLTGMALAALAVGVAILWVTAIAINGIARWNAHRVAAREASPEAQLEKARDNLLVIGATEGRATGFLVLRSAPDQEQVFGIAIPDGTFMEVPGQGFERIGDSYMTGADTSLSAVTNFFTVPFDSYVVVETELYQGALTQQSVAGLLVDPVETNLSEEDLKRFRDAFVKAPQENVALVPMPVRPVNVGAQTYFEPQREEIADLMASWWGVTIGAEESVTRAIVYNGSGVPGVAGQAAQVLIRSGFRVIDTKNADSFDYQTTQVVVQRGDTREGDRVREVLGVGEVLEQPADQDVADVIIIVGMDYEPPDGMSE